MIVLSDPAFADLDSIYDYISGHSVESADEFIDEMLRFFALLERSPRIGRLRRGLGWERVRAIPHMGYLVYYFEVKEGILISRIVHGARRITPDDLTAE